MKLFESFKLGNIQLKNRIVMAPLTRSRALNNIPNDLMAQYYGQRASAGLIIAEGTSPSMNGLGYARIPGCFNQEQVTGWKKITRAVHEKDGKIFLQLMHCGRVSHSANLPGGGPIIAPSAIQLSGQMWTDTLGMQSYPVPTAMTSENIKTIITEYIHAAELAVEAGFDGVELHAANGYLIEQFLNPESNKRTDIYGGSAENHMRFALEIAAGVAKKIGSAKLGIRVSPYGIFNDMKTFEGVDQFYSDLSIKLSEIGLAYIHVVDHTSMGAPPVSPKVKKLIRDHFKGAYILSGGYDAVRAEHDLLESSGDLVAFGRPFIFNPDLPNKIKNKLPLTTGDDSKFYTPGPDGYTDYPA